MSSNLQYYSYFHNTHEKTILCNASEDIVLSRCPNHDFKRCLKIQKEHDKLLKDFNKGAPAMTSRGALKFKRSTASSRKTSNKGLVNKKDIEDLKAAVEKFSSSFDMPGFLMSEMKYKD
ncbi:hypothetical protein Sjap_009056 [Stephania japonica]|uniref:Uncharacterized protein n=1 Tax=Stephania japonica TaxID=461633 RepID=A0AAP0JQT3_9MAGN